MAWFLLTEEEARSSGGLAGRELQGTTEISSKSTKKKSMCCVSTLPESALFFGFVFTEDMWLEVRTVMVYTWNT